VLKEGGGYIEKNNNNGIKGKGGTLIRGRTLVLSSSKSNFKRRKNANKAKEKKNLNKRTNKHINNIPQLTK
jgi:hypothetical protein